jgi:CHAD domain-containing protein
MNLKLPDLENPGSALGEVLSKLAERLAGRIRSLPAGRERSVHDLRLCAKKMRSLLRLACPVVGAGKLSRLGAEIRELKNAFTGSRDTEVMRATVAKFGADEAIAESLIPARPHAPPDLSRFRRKADALCRKIGAIDFSPLTTSQILQCAKKSYRKARKLGGKCVQDASGDLMHEWRKRVKDLQYQSQALGIPPHGVGRLADRLGEYNDLEVLFRHLRKRRVPRELRAVLKEAKKTLREAAFEAAEKVFERKPAEWLKSR